MAMAPLIVSSPRTAVIPDRFDGTPPPPPSASPEDPADSGTSEPADGDVPIIQVGASIPVVDGPAALGSVTVLQYRIEEASSGGSRLLAEVRYRAEQAFEVDPASWVANTVDGDETLGRPATVNPALEAGTLSAGQTVSGWVEFMVAADATDQFLDFRDVGGATLFVVALF